MVFQVIQGLFNVRGKHAELKLELTFGLECLVLVEHR